VIALLRALVEFYVGHPDLLPGPAGGGYPALARRAVAYVSGMTDRYAFETAITHLGWRVDRLPLGVDVP
jgi:dGTPase